MFLKSQFKFEIPDNCNRKTTCCPKYGLGMKRLMTAPLSINYPSVLTMYITAGFEKALTLTIHFNFNRVFSFTIK